MTQIRISGLPPQSLALADDDLFEMVDVDDLVSPTGASKRVRLDQLEVYLNRAVRRPVRVVVTTAVTLSAAIVAGQSAGGVTLAAGNRVLVTAQVDAGANGIYVVQSSGAPLRSADFAVDMAVAGSLIPVTEGTWRGTLWTCDSVPGSDVVGTHTLTFKRPNADNPPFSDVLALVRKAADATALLRFDLTAVSTATTRVLTIPDRNLDLGRMIDGPSPATSTDRGLVVWTGTGGREVASTGVTVDANDKVAVKTSKNVPRTITFGATSTVDGNLGNAHHLTLTGDTELVFTNIEAGQAISLHIYQDGAGGHEVTWPAGISWPDDSVPVVTDLPDRHDWFGFYCRSSGVYDGVVVGAKYAN